MPSSDAGLSSLQPHHSSQQGGGCSFMLPSWLRLDEWCWVELCPLIPKVIIPGVSECDLI
jgi:hypothetical protein